MDLFLNGCNAAIYLLILYGYSVHRRRRLHVRVMLTAFALDMVLLLVVELGNAAVARALRSVTDDAAEARLVTLVHVGFAVAGLVLWFVQIANGWRILRGREDLRRLHGRWGRLFLAARLGNVVTAWMV